MKIHQQVSLPALEEEHSTVLGEQGTVLASTSWPPPFFAGEIKHLC